MCVRYSSVYEWTKLILNTELSTTYKSLIHVLKYL